MLLSVPSRPGALLSLYLVTWPLAALATPAAASKTLVILGSSTAQGVGASSAGASWVGLLASALASRGIAVRNVSIGGTNTSDSLARFDRDVTPSRPDFVILATSVINEPPATMMDSYISGTRALIRKVESIGATPMIVLPYPWSSFTPAQYVAVRNVYQLFSSEGVPIFDFLDAGDDGKGHWLPGLSTDGTHPTDAGHRMLFEAIPPGLFEAVALPKPLSNPQGVGSWLQTTSAGEGSIVIGPLENLSSWSLSYWVKPCDDTAERALFTAGLDVLQLRRAGTEWTLSSGGMTLAKFAVPARPGFRHVAVTFQAPARALAIYVDGVAQPAPARTPLAAVVLFTIGGALSRPEWNARGDRFADVVIYRAPLAPSDIARLASRATPWKSVEAYLPMTFSPTRPSLNLAPSTVGVNVSGTWEWSSETIGSRTGSAFRGRP